MAPYAARNFAYFYVATQCVDSVAKNAEGKYIEESVDAWNIS